MEITQTEKQKLFNALIESINEVYWGQIPQRGIDAIYDKLITKLEEV